MCKECKDKKLVSIIICPCPRRCPYYTHITNTNNARCIVEYILCMRMMRAKKLPNIDCLTCDTVTATQICRCVGVQVCR